MHTLDLRIKGWIAQTSSTLVYLLQVEKVDAEWGN